jgi:hypothetical protein
MVKAFQPARIQVLTHGLNHARWTSSHTTDASLREAGRELEAAAGRAALNAAAKKLMQAKAELNRLQARASP